MTEPQKARTHDFLELANSELDEQQPSLFKGDALLVIPKEGNTDQSQGEKTGSKKLCQETELVNEEEDADLSQVVKAGSAEVRKEVCDCNVYTYGCAFIL